MDKNLEFIGRFCNVLAFSFCGALSLFTANAGQPQEAKLTAVFHEVNLLAGDELHPAALNDPVKEGTVLRTGGDARAELTFRDQALVRLGGNTVFGFKHGFRNLDLTEGVALIRAPKSARGAKIEGKGIAVAVTGTTSVLEYHATSFKFLVLQGTARLYRPQHLGDSVLVRPGQMVIGNPANPVSDPVDFDVARFVKTCGLMAGLPPLGIESLVAKEGERQQRMKSKKTLIETNLVIFGGGSLVMLTNTPNPPPAGSDQTAPNSELVATPNAAVGTLSRAEQARDFSH